METHSLRRVMTRCSASTTMRTDRRHGSEVVDAMVHRHVTAFSFPVVPRGLARIRVQLSAAHTPEQVERCVAAFVAARAAVA